MQKANPLLGLLRCRFVITDSERARGALTDPVRPAVRAARCRGCVGRVRGHHRLADARPRSRAHRAPRSLRSRACSSLVFALTMLSAGFHEFGHAAALPLRRREPGAMGAALIPCVARVLHRRDRLVPTRPARSSPRRPRRLVLQRGVRGCHVRRLGVDEVGRAARHRAAPAAADASAARAPRAASTATTSSLTSPACPTCSRASSRRCRLPPDAVGRPRVEGAEAVGTSGRHAVGARGRARARVDVRGDGLLAPRLAATAWDSLGLQWDALAGAWADHDVLGTVWRAIAIAAIAVPVPQHDLPGSDTCDLPHRPRCVAQHRRASGAPIAATLGSARAAAPRRESVVARRSVPADRDDRPRDLARRGRGRDHAGRDQRRPRVERRGQRRHRLCPRS